ncbi:MAG: hypothetical protein A2X59_06395 [Nitrospirae bacterium GWC2_42_7]|nr:MAG: hypothetical protein A2X59_06395 [Nitrospirae bacterium GWC2_42_7]
MKKRSTIVFALLISVLLFSASAGALEFSADTVITAQGHKTQGKMYGKSDRFRMEISQPSRMIMISRVDKMLAWNIMPDQKIYMEFPLNPQDTPKTEIKGEIDRKQVGAETIDGHPTKKYLITYKEGSRTSQLYQWMATDINFPVKSADINNKWIQEYRNVRIGPQPNSLFELPSGYSKMQMPQMPSGMRAR